MWYVVHVFEKDGKIAYAEENHKVPPLHRVDGFEYSKHKPSWADCVVIGTSKKWVYLWEFDTCAVRRLKREAWLDGADFVDRDALPDYIRRRAERMTDRCPTFGFLMKLMKL